SVAAADVGDRFRPREAVPDGPCVSDLAATVAVTTSLVDPIEDFEVNLQATVRLIDELRRLPTPPPLLVTSTNKVYGCLADLAVERAVDRWQPVDPGVRRHGLDETKPLDFATPYGCSKGGADQYVLDAASSFGVPAVVFRMS